MRLHLSIVEIRPKPEGQLVTMNNQLELEASDTPALVAQTMLLLMEKRTG